VAKTATEESHRVLAVRGIANLLGLDSEIPADEKALLYAEAMALAGRLDEKRLLLAGLGRVGHKDALTLAESLLSNPNLADEARTAIEGIQALIGRPVAVTASHWPKQAYRAVDGDLASRWGTGKPMHPGMWFLIDMGYAQEIESVILDCSGSPGDYPRGYEVYLSNSKQDFGEAVATGRGESAITEIQTGGQEGRYIKILQTGEDGGSWWSIYEVEVRTGGEGD
jgi:hypothetical protein